MNRIKQRFQQLRQAKRKAVITFITAGDPKPEYTVDILHGLVKAGADILELGIPFSDPMAEGPVIQRACERALANGVNLHNVFEMVQTFRQQDTTTPIVLMGYLNPIEIMGYETFVNQAKNVGVDGLIIVDLPHEEAIEFNAVLTKQDIALINLIAPTSTDQRIAAICEHASGFIYYVAFKGVTGASHLDSHDVAQHVNHLRQFSDMPIAVGFGIRDAASAKSIAACADGVVIGTALVQALISNPDFNQARQACFDLVASIRAAVD